jgi:hypothetical protein
VLPISIVPTRLPQLTPSDDKIEVQSVRRHCPSRTTITDETYWLDEEVSCGWPPASPTRGGYCHGAGCLGRPLVFGSFLRAQAEPAPAVLPTRASPVSAVCLRVRFRDVPNRAGLENEAAPSDNQPYASVKRGVANAGPIVAFGITDEEGSREHEDQMRSVRPALPGR